MMQWLSWLKKVWSQDAVLVWILLALILAAGVQLVLLWFFPEAL